MSASDIACPACDGPVPPGTPACPSCGIRLVGQDAARLWEVNQQIAVLRREADSLLASMRRGPVPAAAPAGAPSGPWQPDPYPRSGVPVHPPRRLTGQQLLLGFGALLLLSAVSVFVLVAWTLIGVVGQALILTVVTVGSAVASLAASTHRLTAAAHTAAVIAIGVSVLMALGAWSLGLAGADALSFPAYVVVAGPVLALLWCGYDAMTARAWSPTGATSAYLPAAVTALAAAGVAATDTATATDLLLGVGLLVVAAALLALAAVVRRALPSRRSAAPATTAGVLAVLVAGSGVLALLATAYDLGLGVLERYPAALALLVLGALLLVLPVSVLTGREPGPAPSDPVPTPAAPTRTAPTATSVVRLAGAALAALALGTALLDVPDVAWAAVSAAASVVLAVLALRSAPAAVVRVVGLLAPGAAAVVVLTVEGGSRTLADLLRGGEGQPWVPVAVEVALPALWAAACALHAAGALSTRHADTRGTALPASGAVLGGTVALLLAVAHGTWQWTVPAGLAWVVLAAVLARAASVRLTEDAAATEGAPQPWRPVHATALLAVAYAVVPLGQLLAEATDGRVQAAGFFVVAAAIAWYAAAPGRLPAGYLSAVLVSVGNAVLVDELGADQVELFTLPSAAAFALLGLAQHRTARGTAPGTVLTMGPALAIALVPSLAVATTGDGVLRLLLVVLAGGAALLLGVLLALRAPVLAGSGTLGVVAFAQGSPYLAYVPAWVLLASAGLALLAIGVLWEAALARGRRLGRWVHGLR
jgi:hypothetical protein